MRLPESSQELLQRLDTDGTITVYSGELKQETVVKGVAKIKAAFPSLTPEFYQLFISRVRDKGFTDQRLTEAVNHVIDNCQYPTPTLANFLSFDKRVKVLNYDELCDLVTTLKATFQSYTAIIINGKRFYVRNADKELYNLPNEL